MARWIVAAEESTVAQTGGGGLPGRRGASTEDAPREPAGEWHAVDVETGRAACGTHRFLERWPDRPWASGQPAARCAACLEAVSLDDPAAQ